MSKKYRCFLWATLLLTVIFCTVPLTVNAENENKNLPEPLDPFGNGLQYSVVIYDNTNGLPTSEANAIAQTAEGFIWIGSYGGLVRYDGNVFEHISLENITGVKSLYTDSQNRLWIGSTDDGFAMMKNGSIRYWNESNGFSGGVVRAVAEDESGFIYIATKKGLYFVDSDLNVDTVNDERVREKAMCDLKRGMDGLVYVVDKEGYVFTVKDAVIQQYNYSFCSDPVSVLPSPEQSGYVYVSDKTLNYYGSFNAESSELSLKDVSGISLDIRNMECAGGMAWCCTGTGVYVCDPDADPQYREFRNVSMNSVGHVMQDYQGNFWFTSSRQGVIKIIPNVFDDIYYKYGISENVVNSTCIYKKWLIAATDTGIVCIDKDGANSGPIVEKIYYDNEFWDNMSQVSDNFVSFFNDVRIRSVFSDSHERLWIATWTNGLYCLDGKTLYQYDKTGDNAPLSSNHARIVREAKDGSILIAEEGGFEIMKNKKIIKSYGRENGIENTDILCVEEGLNNEIYLGLNDGGIYIIDGYGNIENIGKKDGLTSDSVMSIKKDRTRNVFWIVTEDSIAYMTENHKITTVTNFPYRNNFELFQNSKDEMWILSSNGIYVVPTSQMLENKEITPVHYGTENGLTRITTANSFSELTENGDLYISGNTGITKVNIETAVQDTPEIKAAVPCIEIDGKKLYPDENGNFHISSQVRKLTIYSHVFNYSPVTPQISYRLEGFDNRFITVSQKNLMQPDYTNLGGGNYRFVLKVTGSNGKEYTTVAVDIVKDRAFYEQIWFYIVLVVLDLLVIAAVAYLTWTARMKKLRQKHKEEVEKERINTELQTASKIQTGTMPDRFPPFPDRTEFDIYASMNPAKEVGGDFYDFFLTDHDHLCMVIADVSGKGVPAALFMMSAKIMISDFAEMGKSPAEILTAVNAKICANNPEKMFVTVWLGILEISTGKLTAANAGHEYPILMQPNGKFEIFQDHHDPMAGFLKRMKYKEYQMELKQGSKLFLYTDGVPEATDEKEQMFGMERLLSALNQETDISLEQTFQNVRNAVDGFVSGAEQFDDLTMMCIEYKKAL